MKSAVILGLAPLALACVIRATPPATQAPFLWIEGENTSRSETYRNAWFDAIDPQELSGGAQIASFSEKNQPTGWAEYDISINTGGNYNFWLRANPSSGITYRLDGNPAVKLDPDALAREDQKLRATRNNGPRVQQWFNDAADGTHDARTMTWYRLDPLMLSRGKHTLRFSLGGHAPNTQHFAAIDCFVLTTGEFTPNFQYKPGEAPTGVIVDAPDSTWAFQPARDDFSPTALLDLRGLNETVAGEHGFIRLSPDGNAFVRGDGKPIRFWGGCDYVQRLAHDQNNQAILEHHARFLAKRGVNIVRVHGAIEPKTDDSKVTDVDASELDQIYRLVAAMKKAGIYTLIDPYWAVAAHAKKNWGVADSGNGNLTALLFFDPALQRGYKAWLKRIYADVNPYTGIPLAKDPAVAVIQLQNEDSMLFWTMQSVQGQAKENLRKLFGKWVLKKYGSFTKAMSAWQGYKADDDDFAHGKPGLFIVWELTEQARNVKGHGAGREARLADQTEFFARTMFDFNKEITRYLRHDLGCKQLVLAGNWRTADQVVLDDAERWSYTADDVIGKNHYFGGIHNGLNTGWQILAGQVYTSRSWTTDPIGSPLGIRQVVGHPFVLPESLWVPPSHYEAEGPLIVAGQTSLTGLGTFFWFCTGVDEWQPPTSKWTYAIPTTLGQFPAAALAYRNGYIKESAPVVHEERSVQDVFARKLPLIAEEGAWDPNRDAGAMPTGTPYQSGVDPLAFLVGRVEVKYGGDPAKSKVIALGKYIDHAANVVHSLTGQITTDIGHGVYRVDAPKIQAAAGFLGAAGPQRLTNVTIACRNRYASVAVIALDGEPIATSHKLLVQVGTESRPTGWKERALKIPVGKKLVDARRILDVGTSPWQIVKANLTVTITNRSLKSAHVLDPNGNPTGPVALHKVAGGVTFRFPPNALYAVVSGA
ncbi:MAG: hypothetical protein ACYC96_13115 [Fimbriimonadaceae bacterium]